MKEEPGFGGRGSAEEVERATPPPLSVYFVLAGVLKKRVCSRERSVLEKDVLKKRVCSREGCALEKGVRRGPAHQPPRGTLAEAAAVASRWRLTYLLST